MENFLKVGVITTTHGVRGEVKVFPTTDDPSRFEDLSYVLLDLGTEKKELHISHVKYFKNLVILKFDTFDTPESVVPFRGRDLYVRREDAAPLGEDEYYIADLIGMQVRLEDGTSYGVLKDVMETGANDVYIIKKPNGKEVLVPAIHECILSVDVENACMTIHLLAGLDDEAAGSAGKEAEGEV